MPSPRHSSHNRLASSGHLHPHARHGAGECQQWSRRLTSAKATERLGRAIGQSLIGGEIVAILGNLGVGKTVLVRGIASGVGASHDAVCSPTFTFIHEYKGRLLLVHSDLYRIDNPKELYAIGLDDYVDGHAILVIEWAEKILSQLPPDHLTVCLEHRTRNTRLATLHATGSRSQELLADTVRRHTG